MENRNIKFRFWFASVKRIATWEQAKKECDRLSLIDMEGVIATQSTGIIDKNGKEIYEGDIIRWRTPYRTTQTHTGDNIPNGSYTEPMEPAIRTEEAEVVFNHGMFTVETEISNMPAPLIWTICEYDEDEIKERIAYRRDGADFWDDPEEGDLQYLLSEYNLTDLSGLIEYLRGVEILGNKFENPELIEN